MRALRTVEAERRKAEKAAETSILERMVLSALNALLGALAQPRQQRALELLLAEAADRYVIARGEVEAVGFLASLSARRAPNLPTLTQRDAMRAKAERLFDNDNNKDGA